MDNLLDLIISGYLRDSFRYKQNQLLLMYELVYGWIGIFDNSLNIANKVEDDECYEKGQSLPLKSKPRSGCSRLHNANNEVYKIRNRKNKQNKNVCNNDQTICVSYDNGVFKREFNKKEAKNKPYIVILSENNSNGNDDIINLENNNISSMQMIDNKIVRKRKLLLIFIFDK